MNNDLEKLDEQALEQLEAKFVRAMGEKERGKLDDAEDTLRDILRAEPRLPEPRMELARLLLDSERLDEAEEHAREALRHLEAGGQWIDDLSEETMLALSHALLAEVLRRRTEDDAVIFGDADVFRKLVAEAHEHFEKAAALDPSDETSSYYAFFLGQPGVKPSIAGETLDEDEGADEDEDDDEGEQ